MKGFSFPGTVSGTRRLAILGLIACATAGNMMGSNAAVAQTLDKVSFATNWVAEAEHGGFYQALADGTYRRYGLDVTIIQGGPQVNSRILLPVGKIDFYLSANTLQSFDAVEQNIPTLVVAAMFQKEPQVLIAHPNQGINDFKDLKNLTLFISKEGMASYFQWLKADYGFVDAQVRPYTFNPQPFLANRDSAMQGYVTSEPFAIEKLTHVTPKVFLIADYGFNSYSTLIETRQDLVERRPTWCSASSMPRSSAGTITSTATTALPTNHQARESGDDRRTARLLGRQDEGISASSIPATRSSSASAP